MASLVNQVSLRKVTPDDLPVFFEQQLDPQANRMAAFTVPDPPNRAAFDARWQHLLNDETVTCRTIVCDGEVAGHVMSFILFGDPAVSYWLGCEFWGRGIATRALAELLRIVTVRPIFARAAQDNFSSLGVLQNCGFQIVGEDRAYANGRGAVVEEYILALNAAV